MILVGCINASIDNTLKTWEGSFYQKRIRYFITFCNYSPTTKDLILKDEILTPSNSKSNSIKNTNEKRLFSQLKNLVCKYFDNKC